MKRMTSENEIVIRKIIETKSKDLIRFLESLVHSSNDAQDLFQSGIIRAIEKSESLEDVHKNYPWILSVFRNLAFDFLREQKKQHNIDSSSIEKIVDPTTEIPKSKVCSCGTHLLKKIPKQYATLLESIEVDGRSVKEIAKDLKTSPGNISVKLHRAKSSLRLAVQKYCNVDTFEKCLNCECDSEDKN